MSSIPCVTAAIELGDKAQVLGCARPGYPATEVDAETVAAWLATVRAEGYRSIVCMLDGTQLAYYTGLRDGGLLEAYRAAGFHVFHYPVADRQEPPVEREMLERILGDFAAMPKPVLIHCSAGIGRTGAVLVSLLQRTGGVIEEGSALRFLRQHWPSQKRD